ncbi:hypothetical protein DFH09DRAFT_1406434 [Mycena vulgaris]|nr:hypothetical protein DFH09DRAFT_1406434 [Mycena vulgaris]
MRNEAREGPPEGGGVEGGSAGVRNDGTDGADRTAAARDSPKTTLGTVSDDIINRTEFLTLFEAHVTRGSAFDALRGRGTMLNAGSYGGGGTGSSEIGPDSSVDYSNRDFEGRSADVIILRLYLEVLDEIEWGLITNHFLSLALMIIMYTTSSTNASPPHHLYHPCSRTSTTRPFTSIALPTLDFASVRAQAWLGFASLLVLFGTSDSVSVRSGTWGAAVRWAISSLLLRLDLSWTFERHDAESEAYSAESARPLPTSIKKSGMAGVAPPPVKALPKPEKLRPQVCTEWRPDCAWSKRSTGCFGGYGRGHTSSAQYPRQADDDLIRVNRARLIEDLSELRTRQVQRIPELAWLMGDIDVEKPEKELLFLPSEYPSSMRGELKLQTLAQVEYTQRIGHAYEQLQDLRTSIRTLNINVETKRTSLDGNGSNTRGQDYLKTLANGVQIAGSAYRKSYAALLKLGLSADDQALKPLLRQHLRGKDGKAQAAGQFWRTGRPSGLSESEEEEWNTELDRVKGFRLRALLGQSTEERETLDEEFSRAVLWFHKTANI